MTQREQIEWSEEMKEQTRVHLIEMNSLRAVIQRRESEYLAVCAELDEARAQLRAAVDALREAEENLAEHEAEQWCFNPNHTAELRAAVDALRQVFDALDDYIEWNGAVHVGCSEDDTCDCVGKPTNDKVNAACILAEDFIAAYGAKHGEGK